MEKNKSGVWNSLLNWLVNEHIKRSNIDFAKAKLIVIVVIVLAVVALLMSIWQVTTGDIPVAAAIFSAGLILSSFPLMLRRVTTFTLPGVSLSLLLYVLITFII